VLHEGLTRLQAGQSTFDLGGGASVQFSGIPEGLHNVLRDLQESPLGKKANQLESMTIEMVAMLFDFIFETRDLPDGIKALLARLQIPVLKAAMLDGAFFAKKSHPSRLLVNALAEAGRGWSTSMGNEDPLYRKIDQIVHRILDGFSDDLAIFDELRADLETFLAEEERNAEANISSSAEEINLRDRAEIAANVARGEVERRIEASPIPKFLANFLRERWQPAMGRVYAAAGDDSEAWGAAVSTLEDLVWSVQPKRTSEDRKHLVALLPSLLKRLTAGVQGQSWPPEVRESFMSNLVEAHAAAVKPTYAHVDSPTAAMAEAAKAQAEVAKAAGDTRAAEQAEALAEAMAPAEPAPPVEEPAVVEDQFLEIARSLERGMWIEFEGDDGQLAFAKLAWISPLRGTYLFTNRQGQKALSMTAEELAERFRADRARPVEAEPLLDRALSTVMGSSRAGWRPSPLDRRRAVAAGDRGRDRRRRDPVGQARRQAPRARDRDARRARIEPRLGELRRRRPRPAHLALPRQLRARRPRVLVRRDRRHARRPHAPGGRGPRSACRSRAIPRRSPRSRRASAPTPIRTAC
jgi:hypothetical protein